MILGETAAQIKSSYFTAGIEVTNDVIVGAAPILQWSVGKSFSWFKYYCWNKDWKVTIL